MVHAPRKTQTQRYCQYYNYLQIQSAPQHCGISDNPMIFGGEGFKDGRIQTCYVSKFTIASWVTQCMASREIKDACKLTELCLECAF